VNRRELVIVGCGAAKLDRPAAAAELYTGQHFRACLLTARALVPDALIRILSARHGLLELDELVQPYDVKLGQAGSITGHELAAQAWERGLLGPRPVTCLCSAAYVALARQVWPGLIAPLAGQGIGCQRHTLAVIRAAAASS
jgi:hypothetical protein